MRVVPLGALLIGVAPAFGFQLPPPSTVGTVAGRVIEAHSGDPAKAIPRVLVVLRHGQEPGTGTYSDEKGNFRLQVEPGAYTAAVERNGYVAASSRNRTITVQAAQTTEDVNLELIRTGAVSGRIVDADGEPRSGVSVQLRPVTEKKVPRFMAPLLTTAAHIGSFKYPQANTTSPPLTSPHLSSGE